MIEPCWRHYAKKCLAVNTKFCEDSRQQYAEWALTDRKVFTKLNKLIKEIERTPFTGTGHPEPLVGESGKWSRHITEKDRLVYDIDGETVNIYSCKGHYRKK
ncbi:Txe/YoeB family addiction module toxin [Spirochaetia bacterium]|nr:Txe/YoeB family addiction module toxin [Spirochaetia bacterium]